MSQRAPSRKYGQSTARARRFHNVDLSSPTDHNHDPNQLPSSHSKLSFSDLSPDGSTPSEKSRRLPSISNHLRPDPDPETDFGEEGSEYDSSGGVEDRDRDPVSRKRRRTSGRSQKSYHEIDSDGEPEVSEASLSEEDELDLARFNHNLNRKVSSSSYSRSRSKPKKVGVAARGFKRQDVRWNGVGKGKGKSVIGVDSEDDEDQQSSGSEQDQRSASKNSRSISGKAKSGSQASEIKGKYRTNITMEINQRPKRERKKPTKVPKTASALNRPAASIPRPLVGSEGRGASQSFLLEFCPHPKKKVKSASQMKWDRLPLSEKKRQLGLSDSDSEDNKDRTSERRGETDFQPLTQLQKERESRAAPRVSSDPTLHRPSTASLTSKSTSLTSPPSNQNSLYPKSRIKSPPPVGNKQSNSALGSLVGVNSRDLPLQDASPDPSPVVDPQHRFIALATDSRTKSESRYLNGNNNGRNHSNPTSSISSNRSIPLPSTVKRKQSNEKTPNLNHNSGNIKPNEHDHGADPRSKSFTGGGTSTQHRSYFLSSKPLPAGDYYSRKKKEESSPTGKTLKVRKSLGLVSTTGDGGASTSRHSSSASGAGTGAGDVNGARNDAGSSITSSSARNSKSFPKARSDLAVQGFKESSLSNQAASTSTDLSALRAHSKTVPKGSNLTSASTSKSRSATTGSCSSQSQTQGRSLPRSAAASTSAKTKATPLASKLKVNANALRANTTTSTGARKPLYQQLPYHKGTKKPNMRTLLGKGAKPKKSNGLIVAAAAAKAKTAAKNGSNSNSQKIQERR